MNTNKCLVSNDKFRVIEINDHHHGKDHVSYMVIQLKPGHWSYVAYSHRTLKGALKRAGIEK